MEFGLQTMDFKLQTLAFSIKDNNKSIVLSPSPNSSLESKVLCFVFIEKRSDPELGEILGFVMTRHLHFSVNSQLLGSFSKQTRFKVLLS